jgi:integrase
MKKTVDIKTLKNLNTPTRFSIPDTKRLHLWVRNDLKKYWVYRFTFDGKRQDISLGSFPETPLSIAKAKAIAMNGKLAKGENPNPKYENATTKSKPLSVTFKKYSSEYIQIMSPSWRNLKHWESWCSTINNYANPVIGSLPLSDITTDQVVKILSPIWIAKRETAGRLRGRLEKIFAAAITSGLRSAQNPAIWKGHLEHLLPNIRKSKRHHAAMAYKELPDLFTLLTENPSVSSLALQFTILTASRTNEVLKARRSEVFERKFTIPADRMKANREHQIPLCDHALDIIAKANALDPESEYLFSKKRQHLSSMSMLMLLRRLKPELKLTVHGFRSSFRDWISEETEYSNEVAEMALAHVIPNRVEAAYRRGNLLDKRRLLMEEWESFCFQQKT